MELHHQATPSLTHYRRGFITPGYLPTCFSTGPKTGEAGIEAYGTSLPNGQTFGTFLITSGPAVFAGPPWTVPTGGLGGLAGYGTFSSLGEPPDRVRLVEHRNCCRSTER